MPRKQVYSDADIIAALEKNRGLVYAAARKLGCRPGTIYERAQVSEDVREAIGFQKGLLKDLAESKLLEAIVRGEAWAICFFLKTQAKDRGYIERSETEVTGRAGGPVTFHVVYDDEPPEPIDPDPLS